MTATGGVDLSWRRCALIVVLAACLAASLAEGQEGQAPEQPLRDAFSRLTIVAFGDQEIDILTGITTLPEGGQVIDRELGFTLTAETIRYREGDFVEAQAVEVTGEFGRASAESVTVDLEAGRLDAGEEVDFARDELGIAAGGLHYYVDESVVRFDGPVRGTGVEFEAAGALLDAEHGVFLLIGPYRYQDELFELSSEREGALLSLTPTGEDGESLAASSRVAPELLDRLAPYLP